MSDKKLLDAFESYDSANPVPSAVENEDLKRLALKPLAYKVEERKLKTKKNGLLDLAAKVEDAINLRLKEKGIDKKLKFGLTFSAALSDKAVSESPVTLKNFNSQMSEVPVLLNVNLKKISKLPALEAYAVMYGQLDRFAREQLEPKEKSESPEPVAATEQTGEQDRAKEQAREDKKQAVEALSGYLKGFLSKYFGTRLKDYDILANVVAGEIVNEMPEKDVKQVLGTFFDFGSVSEESVSIAKSILSDPLTARVSHVRRKATELSIDPSRQLEALGYEQQAEELLSVGLKDKFNEAVMGYDPNNKNIPLNQFKDFCVSYANSFMHANGLKPIAVTFSSEGELGTFYDSGTTPRVNINLSKIDSISELAATLSHELTHAVDASINKVKGNYNREGGGLLNDISENISGSGLKTDSAAYKFLCELQKLTYLVNPNEVHARIGELSALKFMQAVCKDNPGLSAQTDASAKSFVNYQCRTLNAIDKIKNGNYVAELKSRMAALGDLPETARNMMNERINYLERMANSALVSEKSIAQAIAEGLDARGMVQRDSNGKVSVNDPGIAPEMRAKIEKILNGKASQNEEGGAEPGME